MINGRATTYELRMARADYERAARIADLLAEAAGATDANSRLSDLIARAVTEAEHYVMTARRRVFDVEAGVMRRRA